ncbi:hypothetical protein D1872_226300 [compost metagenome]
MSSHEKQQLKLFGREIDFFAVQPDFPTIPIECKPSVAPYVTFCFGMIMIGYGRDVSQPGLDSGHHNIGIERLRNIVVAPKLEAQ